MRFVILRMLSLAGIVLSGSGCTVVGYHAGKVVDQMSGRQTREWHDLETVGRNDRVRVILKNGQTASGTIAALHTSPDSSIILVDKRARASIFHNDVESTPMTVPFDEVKLVVVPRARIQYLGLVVGMAADALLVIPAITGGGILFTVPD